MDKLNLKLYSTSELEELLNDFGLPKYRVKQLVHWIYEKKVLSIKDITVFSKDLRQSLDKQFYISRFELLDRQTSVDGTEKFLFKLEDGKTIESVVIPDNDRLTLCVSSQVGCAMGCKFCRTASGGLQRNLKAHEIVEQIMESQRLSHDKKITNIVMMGMGEPLMNFDELAEAIKRITGLLGFSSRRITVSTSGVVPGLLKLGQLEQHVNLAVSLNAPLDSIRDTLMPINRKYPLKSLLDTLSQYPLKKNRRITFEYVMFSGLNDSIVDAKRIVKLLKGLKYKMNLIPFNPYEGSEFGRPDDEKILRFQDVFNEAGIPVFVRKSKGADILAACGQLRHKKSPDC